MTNRHKYCWFYQQVVGKTSNSYCFWLQFLPFEELLVVGCASFRIFPELLVAGSGGK
jgi:hypothetical protein